MRIQVRNTTVVRPASMTPRTSLWISNLDATTQTNYHASIIYFFRWNGAPNFFDSTVLKAALSRALVQFYPMAGRLKLSGNRIEIDCNEEGVSFADAESDGRIDDLGDFSPRPDLSLAPAVDYSGGISAYPLYLVQLTRFKCGGVSLGVASESHLFDGTSAFHFVKTWSGITRGLDVAASDLPFLDRRAVLSARNPPQPMFSHTEYQPSPPLKIPQNNAPNPILSYKRFKLTRDQLDVLRARCADGDSASKGKSNCYSTFELVAGHAWRCITKARGLPGDQLTKMYILVNGRSRMRPPLPQGYFGNAVFMATAMATAGELCSKPFPFFVNKIHDAIARIDGDYTASALDYLELQPDLSSLARGPHTFKCPNMAAIGWHRMPLYDVDFGWGRPGYVGHGAVPCEGKTFVLPSPEKDGSIWYAVTLPEDVMRRFERAFYQDLRAGDEGKRSRSRI